MVDLKISVIRSLRRAMLCAGKTHEDIDRLLGWKLGSCRKLLTTHSHRLHLNGCSDIALACGFQLNFEIQETENQK